MTSVVDPTDWDFGHFVVTPFLQVGDWKFQGSSAAPIRLSSCLYHGDWPVSIAVCLANRWTACRAVERPPDQHMVCCRDDCGPCGFFVEQLGWGSLTGEQFQSYPIGGDLVDLYDLVVVEAGSLD